MLQVAQGAGSGLQPEPKSLGAGNMPAPAAEILPDPPLEKEGNKKMVQSEDD